MKLPNHVTNRLTISGDAISVLELRKSCFTVRQQEELPDFPAFDFNKIIPVPAFISTGDLYINSREEKTGRNWYEFKRKYWGTKWNAYETRIITDVADDATGDIKIVFAFDTAWNTPEPIIETLAMWFKELSFHHEFFDEGWNFAGTRTYSGGEIKEINEPKRKENPDLWGRLYRELKCHDHEENH